MGQRHVEGVVSRWERRVEVDCSQRAIRTRFHAIGTLAGTVFTVTGAKTGYLEALSVHLFGTRTRLKPKA